MNDQASNGSGGAPQDEAPQLTSGAVAEEARRGRIASLFGLGAVLFTSGSVLASKPILEKAASLDDWTERLSLFHEYKTELVLAAGLFAIAAALTLPLLLHIALAIRARRPTLPKIVVHLTIAGPLLMALAIPAVAVLYSKAASDFDSGAVQTIAEAERLARSTAMSVAQVVLQAGTIAAGFAWVMIGVYGIRTGLLTRTVGVSAVAVGVFTALFTSLSFAVNSIPSLIEIVRVFVLGALSVMLVGSPEKRPPAWREGRAIPWVKRGAQPPPEAGD